MGYKLAGFEVLGGVEIDPEMMEVYRSNHRPKHSFLMGVGDFNQLPREKIPADLFNLDILDGSPPCSSFSMAGSREKAWGTKKKFREGQTEQVLDDLFFQFLETANILRPKVVVAENVKGLVIGKAKGYVKQIFNMFNIAGYDCCKAPMKNGMLRQSKTDHSNQPSWARRIRNAIDQTSQVDTNAQS